MSIIETGGLFDPRLAPLLEHVLQKERADFESQAALSLNHAYSGKYKEAISLAERARDVSFAPKRLRRLLGQLVRPFQFLATEDAAKKALPLLRKIHAGLQIQPEESKGFFDAAAIDLTAELGSRLALQLVKDNGGPAPNVNVATYIPGLTARQFWDAERFELSEDLIANAAIMSEELARIDDAAWLPTGSFTDSSDARLVDQGAWLDIGLFSQGRFNETGCLLLPSACDLARRHPEVTTNPHGVMLLSKLLPGTDVKRHHGSANSQLTFHLGLRIPAEDGGDIDMAGLQVGGKRRSWSQQQVTVFDDSFEHGVWNHCSGPRIVLLLRAWHPEVSIEERQLGLKQVVQQVGSTWADSDAVTALHLLRSRKTQTRWKQHLTLFTGGNSVKA